MVCLSSCLFAHRPAAGADMGPVQETVSATGADKSYLRARKNGRRQAGGTGDQKAEKNHGKERIRLPRETRCATFDMGVD